MSRYSDRSFPDLETRFIAKLVISGAGCWLWQGHIDAKGYGVFGIGARKITKAHRYSYEKFIGPVPEGLYLDHLCRNRNCVNPHHLEVVTNAENVRRGIPFRSPRMFCKRGHALTEDNVYVNPRGAKTRKECRRNFAKNHREKRKFICAA